MRSQPLAAPSAQIGRLGNTYTSHVKSYAEMYGIPYKQAMKDASASWQRGGNYVYRKYQMRGGNDDAMHRLDMLTEEWQDADINEGLHRDDYPFFERLQQILDEENPTLLPQIREKISEKFGDQPDLLEKVLEYLNDYEDAINDVGDPDLWGALVDAHRGAFR